MLSVLLVLLLATPASEAQPGEAQMRSICEEIRQSSQAPRDLEAQRSELNKQAAEIADARAALAKETARLTELIALASKSPSGCASKKASDAPEKKPELEGLAKTLSGMKPAKSAAMVLKLAPALASGALARLEPSRRAAILEKMPADRAAELVSAMSGEAAQ
jgi:flagellar motility protein MotE (MotC chaperone)